MYNFTALKDEVIAELERALMVDIGGGRGRALIAIAEETENAWGTEAKVGLQDKPPVLDSMPQESIPSVEKMTKNAVAAMIPTSRLLIGDLVIPAMTKVGEDMSPY
ncbi:hypothetical protein BJ875DRAFT_479946 [Amylocarpus encephaloides]|uniref:Uncharacterized protein n=1 Tax=Amylocarpus encephaloides TaxID=45428 RepID=A0A9P8C9W3_9HELO|nr:hypothetical protein BJ875DRAFT_479946 [Amylocarpus encephaloides]